MSQIMGSAKSKNVPPPPPPPPPLKSVSNDERLSKVKAMPNVSPSIPLKVQAKPVPGKKQDSPVKKQSSPVKKQNSPEKKSRSPQSTTSPLVLSDGSSTPSTSPKLSSKSTSKSGSNSKSTSKSGSGSNSKSASNSASNSKSSGSKSPQKSQSPQKSPKQVSSDENQKSSKSTSRRTTKGSDVEISRNDVPFFNEEECADSEDEFSFTCCMPPNAPRFPKNPRPYREWDPAFLPATTNIPTSIGRKCRRCGKPVYVAELYLSSRGVYHSECYKCCLCGKTLDSWSVAEFKGEVFCKGCHRRNFGAHGVGFGVGAGVLQTP